MSFLILGDVLKGLIPTAAQQQDALQICREQPLYQNNVAITTTTTLPEIPFFVAKHKCRLVGADFQNGAVAAPGQVTNFYSVIISKRAALTPAVQKILVQYDANATPAKDIAAFANRDLYASGDVNVAAADADFILLPAEMDFQPARVICFLKHSQPVQGLR